MLGIFGNPEVGKVDVAAFIQQQVRGLQIAVDDALAVRGSEPGDDLGSPSH